MNKGCIESYLRAMVFLRISRPPLQKQLLRNSNKGYGTRMWAVSGMDLGYFCMARTISTRMDAIWWMSFPMRSQPA